MRTTCLAAVLVLLAPSFFAADSSPASPGADAPPRTEPPLTAPSELSDKFWTEWSEAKSSGGYAALKSAVGCAEKTTTSIESQRAAVNAGRSAPQQTVIDIAINRPEDAAAFLNHAADASKDKVRANALATVLNMVTSPKTRERAVPLISPEAKPRVMEWAANLTTGIRGLPGIYLGKSPGPLYWSQEFGARPPMPVGYRRVGGPSVGCPVR